MAKKKGIGEERRDFLGELYKKATDYNEGTVSMPWWKWNDIVLEDFRKHRVDYIEDPINARIFTPSHRLRKRGAKPDHWLTVTYLNSQLTRKHIRDYMAKTGHCFAPLPFNGMVSTKDGDVMKLSQNLTYGATKTKIKNDNLRSRLLNKFGHELGMISTRLRLPATT